MHLSVCLCTQGPKPPHLYALTNTMYHNMMMEHENQCVIIRYEPIRCYAHHQSNRITC